MGVLFWADLTGHGHLSPSAKKGGMAVPCLVSPQKDTHAGFWFFYFWNFAQCGSESHAFFTSFVFNLFRFSNFNDDPHLKSY